jgi:hypothetical protein
MWKLLVLALKSKPPSRALPVTLVIRSRFMSALSVPITWVRHVPRDVQSTPSEPLVDDAVVSPMSSISMGTADAATGSRMQRAQTSERLYIEDLFERGQQQQMAASITPAPGAQHKDFQ